MDGWNICTDGAVLLSSTSSTNKRQLNQSLKSANSSHSGSFEKKQLVCPPWLILSSEDAGFAKMTLPGFCPNWPPSQQANLLRNPLQI